MKSYTQLNQHQRYQLAALLKAGLNQTEIAEILGVHKSTVSREIKRKKGLRGYRPKQARQLAGSRQANKAKTRIESTVWVLIEHCIREGWSPEQISDWLKIEKGLSITHEWIYLHIYDDKYQRGALHTHLRCQKMRKKRYGSNDRRGQIKN